MTDFDSSNSSFKKPPRIIYTTGVESVETGIEVWLREPEPSIMLILGPYGIGKTKAAEYCVQQSSLRRHTGQRQYGLITVPERATRLSLPQAILEQLGERPRGRRSVDLIEQTIEFLSDNDYIALFLDEGDRFVKDSFEPLKDFHDAAVARRLRCRFAIVALPKILDLIKRHGQFQSRATSQILIEPLSEDEIIEKFLPNLDLPRWRFDPKDPMDREVGRVMWQRTTPVLRILVAWISKACGFAEVKGKEFVTLDEIIEATVLLNFGELKPKEIELSEGTFERSSELRKWANLLKNSGK